MYIIYAMYTCCTRIHSCVRVRVYIVPVSGRVSSYEYTRAIAGIRTTIYYYYFVVNLYTRRRRRRRTRIEDEAKKKERKKKKSPQWRRVQGGRGHLALRSVHAARFYTCSAHIMLVPLRPSVAPFRTSRRLSAAPQHHSREQLTRRARAFRPRRARV